MLSLLLFPIVLVSGFRLVAYADDDQLKWLIRLAFFSLITKRINESFVHSSSPAGLAGKLLLFRRPAALTLSSMNVTPTPVLLYGAV